MIWILILLFILIMIQIIVIGVCFSNIVLNVSECDISYNVDCRNKINIKKLKVNVGVYLFKKIKILNIKIFKDYFEIFKIKFHLNFLETFKRDKTRESMFIIKNIGDLDPEIKKINLNLSFGTESTMLTVFLIPTITTLISGIISNYMEENNNLKQNAISNCNLKIMPRYLNTNNFSLNLSTQISFDTLTTLVFIKKHREIKLELA